MVQGIGDPLRPLDCDGKNAIPWDKIEAFFQANLKELCMKIERGRVEYKSER